MLQNKFILIRKFNEYSAQLITVIILSPLKVKFFLPLNAFSYYACHTCKLLIYVRLKTFQAVYEYRINGKKLPKADNLIFLWNDIWVKNYFLPSTRLFSSSILQS